MLDNETKRRIDSARQILVGKVPDPKAQVEQITTAMIYKFMDDMDQESVEIGGKTKFFDNGFEQYAWSKLLSTSMSGFDRLNLYVEAITKMSRNPHLPQLFRNIFKDAFLPYRDPETLNLFLKEINEFVYDHSERLGDAFEYLLSVLGSQGDAGQFRTPRHIIKFIVEAIDPKKDETILDPACGTAGFLISAYKHIMEQNKTIALTPDEKERLMNNFMGYDISPDMVKLSLVNMYLHKFPNPNVFEYDTLTSEDKWDDTYDVILANPPFMSPKGGIRPHKRFSVQAKRSEVLFVDYIAEHLNINGRAGVIVPEGIIFQSQNAYKDLRKMLVENYLYAVVSLPAGVFNPYSGVKTSILLMDKSIAKRTNNILFVKIENDGYGLGAQRRKIDKDDLPTAIEIIKKYMNVSIEEDAESQLKELVGESKLWSIVPKDKTAEDGDYNLNPARYYEIDNSNIKYKLNNLINMAEVISGQSPPSDNYNTDGQGIPFYQGKTEFREIYIGEPTKWTTKITKTSYPNDILMSVRAPVGPVNLSLYICCIGRGLAAIRARDNVDYKYLFLILRNKQDRIIGGGGSVFDSITRTQIEKIQIPLPPLEVQKEIVAEIDGYQKIIDGARQVVENYKPHIKIDPDWPMVDLGELCDIKTGKLNANKSVDGGKYPFFTCSKEVFRINDYAFDCEAVLLSGNNATGNFDVKYYKGKFNAYQRTYVITINKKYSNELLYGLLEYSLNDNLENLKGQSIGGLTRYLTLSMITTLKIPFPPLSSQKVIIDNLEKEQMIVNSNKKLIEIFEQKIQDRISEVWGE